MLLNLEEVRKNRGDGYGLEIRSLAVARGECLAITGPSGCGKSTTLDIIGMALEPDEAVRFDFSPADKTFAIEALWKRDEQAALATLRREYTGYILQTGEIFNFLNVRENIELTPLASGGGKDFASKKTSELLESLEISHLAEQMPATLSIGQRQRVAIARALAPEPAMILADEPTSALDPLMARQVMGLMLEAVASCGTTLIMVSHDPGLLSEFSLRQVQIKISKRENGMLAILDSQ